MMKLGRWVHCTKISTEFDCQGQRSRVKVTKDKKIKSAAFCSGVILWSAVVVRHFFSGSVLWGTSKQVMQLCLPPLSCLVVVYCNLAVIMRPNYC